MGKRGPLPKSPALRIAGKAGEKARPKNVFPTGRPTRPSWLVGEARAEWDRIIPELDAADLLSVVDRAALAAYCQAWAELVWATDELGKTGRVVGEQIQSAKGELIGERLKAHPAVKLQRDAFNRVKVFVCEFGLSPASRVRVGGSNGTCEGQTSQAGNPFAEIAARVKVARIGAAS